MKMKKNILNNTNRFFTALSPRGHNTIALLQDGLNKADLRLCYVKRSLLDVILDLSSAKSGFLSKNSKTKTSSELFTQMCINNFILHFKQPLQVVLLNILDSCQNKFRFGESESEMFLKQLVDIVVTHVPKKDEPVILAL